jgi:hypothetical protein
VPVRGRGLCLRRLRGSVSWVLYLVVGLAQRALFRGIGGLTVIVSFRSIRLVLAHIKNSAFDCDESRLVRVHAWEFLRSACCRPPVSYAAFSVLEMPTVTLCQLLISDSFIGWRLQLDLGLGLK